MDQISKYNIVCSFQVTFEAIEHKVPDDLVRQIDDLDLSSSDDEAIKPEKEIQFASNPAPKQLGKRNVAIAAIMRKQASSSPSPTQLDNAR